MFPSERRRNQLQTASRNQRVCRVSSSRPDLRSTLRSGVCQAAHGHRNRNWLSRPCSVSVSAVMVIMLRKNTEGCPSPLRFSAARCCQVMLCARNCGDPIDFTRTNLQVPTRSHGNPSPLESLDEDDFQKRARATVLIREDQLSKARTALLNEPPAAFWPAVRQMHERHRTPPSGPVSLHALPSISLVQEALLSFAQDSAGEPSGLLRLVRGIERKAANTAQGQRGELCDGSQPQPCWPR